MKHSLLTNPLFSGGKSHINNRYGGSPAKAVAVLYPEYDWKMWHFKKIPRFFWESLRNQVDQPDQTKEATISNKSVTGSVLLYNIQTK